MNTPQKYTLFKFGLKQALKGAIIVGILAGFYLALQGIAYEKAYPNAVAREKFATSLSAAPGLGFIYGNPSDLHDGTPGYMVYRVLGFMGVVVAVWALVTMTKMLRGAEEDGRFEIIRTGAVTPRQATAYLALGFAGAWWIALLLSYVITLLSVRAGGISTTASAMLLLNVAIFLPGLLFAGIGLFTSQLGLTRGRALLYGMVPLAAFFLLRGVGNTNASLHWLMYYTPFGWAQFIDPLHGSGHPWIYLFVFLALAFGVWGIWLAQRDYGSSIIKTSTTIRSHFALLGSSWKLSLRQNAWVIIGYAIGALVMIGLIAGLANTAVNTLQDGGNLSKSVRKLAGGGNSLKVAFLGAGMLFMVMVLLNVAISVVGSIRKDEAKQYLDNILVAPRRRATWLISRLLLGFGIVLAISLAGGLLLYAIASAQHISLDIWKVLATCICAVGSIGFLIGLGALLYGLRPRLATIIMYVVIGWSFLVTLLASATKINTTLLHSSLFQYTSFNLAQWPDWATFGWLTAIGLVLAAVGIRAFTQRDIIPE